MLCPCDHSSAPLFLVPSRVDAAISLLKTVPSLPPSSMVSYYGQKSVRPCQTSLATHVASFPFTPSSSFIKLITSPVCVFTYTVVFTPLWKIYLVENISTFVICSPLPLSGETGFQSFSCPSLMVRAMVLLKATISDKRTIAHCFLRFSS